MRRLAIALAAAAAVLALMGEGGGVARAQANGEVGPVHVLQVSGLIDPILADEISTAIDRAADAGAQALVLQTNSRGSVLSRSDMQALLEEIADAPLPIGVWVGPSGARLYGTPAQLLGVADVTGMAAGSRVGHAGVALTVNGELVDLGPGADRLAGASVGLQEARQLDVFRQRISDEGIPTLSSMVFALDGYEEGGVVLDTVSETVADDGTVSRETIATVVQYRLGLVDQLFHTVASPPITYLLLLIGLALLVFEFFTAGIGVAGVVGAVCTVLAATGLATLPARGWAIALIVAAMLACSIDVQVGIPRFWTGVGIVLTIVGSLALFEPLPGNSLRPTWLALVAGIGGTMLTFIVGMPSMVRTRFATPTIGREWMIGELGTVVTDVDPDGAVEVGTARWRARTNRATPVKAGDQVRVVAIDGVTLEVEPLEGAARDHRQRRPRDVD